jgi:hypothetical protein
MEMQMAQLRHLRKDDPNAGVLLLNLLGVSKHSSWRQFNKQILCCQADHSELDTPARSITSCEAYWGHTPFFCWKQKSQENLGLEFRIPELKRFSFVFVSKTVSHHFWPLLRPLPQRLGSGYLWGWLAVATYLIMLCFLAHLLLVLCFWGFYSSCCCYSLITPTSSAPP